jgi:hypothetical protein
MGEEKHPMMILTYCLLRLYPASWRERYAEEMRQVLKLHPVTIWTALDVLLGAFDAHLYSGLLPSQVVTMGHRIRTSEIMIFCAFVLFGVAWLSIGLVRDPLAPWENVVRLHPEILTVFSIEQIAGGVAFLAMVAGGLPILLATLRHAIRTRRWNLLLLLCIPVVAVATLLVYGLLTVSASTTRQSTLPSAPLTPLAVLLQLGLLVLFVMALVVSVAAVAQAVNQSDLNEELLRLVLWPAAILTAAILVGLLAAAILTAEGFTEAPELAPGNLLAMTVLMAVATFLAVFALRRGIAAAGGTAGYSRTSS